MRSLVRAVLPSAILLTALTPLLARAQSEGPAPTQMLVQLEGKQPMMPEVSDLKLTVDGKRTQIDVASRLQPATTQLAILVDDGLRTSFGRDLGELKDFLKSVPPGTQVFLGYMEHGTVTAAIPFTTQPGEQADKVRLPLGSPGISASPYLCLSDFLKHWPDTSAQRANRVVLMITNGVDPYNGSTSPLNQDSPYVDAAAEDAQRAGVPVYSIYANETAERGEVTRFSGQSYLSQVADATGGTEYAQGLSTPISLTPFLKEFQHALAETITVQFHAPADRHLVRVKLENAQRSTKLQYPHEVQPGSPLGEQ
jgi:hypothetical protein